MMAAIASTSGHIVFAPSSALKTRHGQEHDYAHERPGEQDLFCHGHRATPEVTTSRTQLKEAHQGSECRLRSQAGLRSH